MHMDRVRQLVRYWCDDTFSGKCLGKGVTAAVLDTGLAPHPDFRGRVRVFLDMTKGKKQLRQPYDDSGHGTHVAGILAGDGRMSGGLLAGMAPEAELVILKVLDEKGEGSIEDILRGILWVEENAVRLGIRVVNISVGAKSGLGEEKERRLLSAVEMLWDQNLVVTVSAGNQGPGEGSVAVPGTSRKIITVGALKTGTGVLNCSGRGPTRECVVKPDLFAPGYLIRSCSHRPGRRSGYYTAKSGTSMAAPVVCGAAALYLCKYPEASNTEVKLRLLQTALKTEGGKGERCLDVKHFLH